MHSRNIGKVFSIEDQEKMLNAVIGIIGVGGVGSYIAEHLSRTGCKKLIIFDGDTFNTTNLNRQLFSTSINLGQNKAIEAKQRLNSINPNLEIEVYDQYADYNEFCIEKLSQCNLIFSCGIPYEKNPIGIKQLFYNLIFIKRIPVVTGGVTIEGVSCAAIISGQNLKFFNSIFDNYIKYAERNITLGNSVSSLSHFVSLAASLETNLGIKYLCGKKVIVDKTIQYNCVYDYLF